MKKPWWRKSSQGKNRKLGDFTGEVPERLTPEEEKMLAEQNESENQNASMPILPVEHQERMGHGQQNGESKVDIHRPSQKPSGRDTQRSAERMGRQRPIGINQKSSMKLCLFDVREYGFTSKDGREIHGFMYSAFAEGGPIQFSSPNGKHDIVSVVTFDAKKAVEIDIRPSLFDGKLKYREDV